MAERLAGSQLQYLGERTRRVGNTALAMLTHSRTITGLALLGGAAGIIGGLSMWPEWSAGIDYFRHIGPSNLNGVDAMWRLLTWGDDPAADAARRFVLQIRTPIKVLQTWNDLAKMGSPTPPSLNPNDYVLDRGHIHWDFISHTADGFKVTIGSMIGIATLIGVKKAIDVREGPKSEYSPEYAQVQRRYDLDNTNMVGQIEALIENQTDLETYQMEQTYFQSEWCNQVMAQLFRGNSGQRKQALASIGLGKNDEIQEGEFRLVTKNGVPLIVLRVKRHGQGDFGKETFYADQGYPLLLAEALSRLVGHTDVTTVKTRTELRREVSYVDPETGKQGTTVAILNYDRYQHPQKSTDICHRRVEVVIPALAGVKPEDVFPEFFAVLSQSEESKHNDKQIGHTIIQGNL